MIPALLLACTEYGFTDARWTDTYQQDRANEVDLLIVVDNSCSMVEEQDNLARNFDALLGRFVEAEVDWRIAVTTTDVEAERYRGRLQGGDDEVVLRGPSGEIDRVEYTRDWGFEDGISLGLSSDRTLATDNDVRGAWCRQGAFYGSEQGTPGEPNIVCGTGRVQRYVPTGPDTGPRAPTAADLLITELHPQSLEDDRRCEWIELTSRSPDTLQLGGLELSDRGRNHAVLPDFLLEPGGIVVIGRSTDACGAPVDIVLETGFSLNDDLRWIDAGMPDADELFAEAVSQGTLGIGIELGLEAARLTLEEPAYTDDNQAFLRDGARFALLFVSDEDDLSPLPVDSYLDRFMEVKGLAGYRDPSRVTVSAVVGDALPPAPGAPSCTSETGFGTYGERYLAAANRTGGLTASICAEDFAPIVSQLGLTLTGVSTRFELSRVPLLDTLEVRLYADTSEASFVRELLLDVDFTYDVEGNALVFTEDQAPPPSFWLSVSYNEDL
ncbi:MAG: lamin tail domain-containing protein [Alphaproteobacteria bacterium]|nr:lamin tail domain-containing protein [Alphaproteobacteria bacterium]